MRVSHSYETTWGKLNRLDFWRYGFTLDLGHHRWIVTIRNSENDWEDEL